VSFAQLFIANPDLPSRHGHPLAQADLETSYQGGERGYADYPAFSTKSVADHFGAVR
jgi:N-ethylmaleimide reductase